MNKIVKKDGSIMSDEEIFDEVVNFHKKLYPNCKNIGDSLGKTLYQGGKSFVLTKTTYGSIRELTTHDIEGLTGGKLPIRCKKCGCWSHL